MVSRRSGISVSALISLMALALLAPSLALALQPGTSIHGVVTNAKTGAPIQGAVVSVYSLDADEDFSAVTDALGMYEVATTVGVYDVSCYVSDKYEHKTAHDVSADPSAPATVNFAVTPYDKAFHGVVTDSTTGLPIASAAVVAESVGGSFTTLVRTDAQGQYEIVAPAGTYEIGFAATGYQSRLIAGKAFTSTPVEVSAALSPLVTAVHGTVTNAADGTPVTGALVTLSWLVPDPQPGDPGHMDRNETWATTNADGYYKFTAQAGTYQVQVASYGFVPALPQDAVFDGTHALQRDFGLIPKVMEFVGVTTISCVPDAGGGWSTSDVTFTLTVSDTGDAGVMGTYFTMGGGVASEYTDPVTVIEEGETVLAYWSVDEDSNQEQSKSKTIRIDKTAPLTTSNVAGSYVNAAVVKFSATDVGGSGVKATKHRWNADGTWTTGEAKISTPGVYTLQYFSEDNAGNAEPVKQVTVSVRSAVSLTAKATPSAPAKYGAATRISGYLRKGTSTGPGVGGQVVRIQRKTDGAWMTVKTLTTPSSGYVHWDTVVRSKAEYRLFYAGKTHAFEAKTSATVTVTPKAYLSKAVGKRVSSQKYKLSGTLMPRHAAGSKPVRIYLWRKVGRKWKSAGYIKATASNSSSYSKYSVTYKFSRKGKWRLRAIHPTDSGHAKSYSDYSYLTVK